MTVRREIQGRNECEDHVRRVVRHALAQAQNIGEDDVSETLAQAVALGSGPPESIRAAAMRLPNRKPLELIRFDTDQIGAYVFESKSPPILQGASKTLELLNEDIAKHPKLEEYIIFSGGGEGLLLIPRMQNGRNGSLGLEICEVIRQKYRQKTEGALTVTTYALPVGPEDFINKKGRLDQVSDGVKLTSGTRAIMARIQDGLRTAKGSRRPDDQPVFLSKNRCRSCRDREGKQAVEKFGGYLCDPCHSRWLLGRKGIEGTSFEDIVKPFRNRVSKAEYLGFIYVDGNAMGEFFAGLSSLAEIRFASQAVASVFEDVDREVESLVGHEIYNLLKDTWDGNISWLSLLGGGDEKIWIIPAVSAVEVCRKLPCWIRSHTGDELSGLLPKLTAGIGMVLCDHKYPVRYQYEMAKVLLQNAKKCYYADRAHCVASLDFEVVTDASPLSEEFDTARFINTRTGEKNFFNTCRPYRISEFNQLLDGMEIAMCSMSKSQLYGLQVGAEEGESVFLNYAFYQIARNKDKYKNWLAAANVDSSRPDQLRDFLVRPSGVTGTQARGTWVGDMLQLLPFVAWKGGNRRAAS